MLQFHLRSQVLTQDDNGHTIWQEQLETKSVDPARAAIIICDMWDNHWSRGAAERVNAMVARMNDVVRIARGQGVHIIHAPSDTMDFYVDAPARQRMLAVPPTPPPPDAEHPDPPLPIDASDHGSDTGERETFHAWSRQHPAIEIDPERDGKIGRAHV